jgi:protein-S-isoprenylcysteine O-methyltransferase Ste14
MDSTISPDLLFKLVFFGILSLGISWISRYSLKSPRVHGFYRYFSWELILILFLLNFDVWFNYPFRARQLISWIFLIISLVLIYLGVNAFRRAGKIDPGRDNQGLIGIEKTTQLVTSGVYRYIRHPFYSSLLFLSWGITLKNVNWVTIMIAMAATGFLVLASRTEERENQEYFGEQYKVYIQQTKMFIPYVL